MKNHLFDGLLTSSDPQRPLAFLPDGRTCSYGEILAASARYTNLLKSLEIKQGDRIAVQVSKSFEVVILYLACLRLGAVFLPLNTAYTAGEVTYFLSDASPSLFVCDPAKRSELEKIAVGCSAKVETMGGMFAKGEHRGSLPQKAALSDPEFENCPADPHSIAAILYTSGTTGRSKGAMLSHENLLSNARTLAKLWQFSTSDILLHALPVFHTHGLFVATNIALVTGSSMIFLPGFNADAVIENLPKATAMMGVPTFYTRLLEDDRLTPDLVAHMRLFISGSAPLLTETHQAFEKRTGMRILERYGMTETNMISSNPYDGERRAGTVGFALPGTDLRIVDPESGTAVADGEIGSIEVTGPNVFSGYWKMPEKTAEDFRDDGYFITGDLGQIDDHGYLHIVGRSKDLIISGGYNIYPKEVEMVLDEQDGVLESAVIGVPHPDFGEGVVGVVVLENPSLSVESLMEEVKGQIARFKQPKAIKIVVCLPRNTMGKVQKQKLREEYRDLFLHA